MVKSLQDYIADYLSSGRTRRALNIHETANAAAGWPLAIRQYHIVRNIISHIVLCV